MIGIIFWEIQDVRTCNILFFVFFSRKKKKKRVQANFWGTDTKNDKKKKTKNEKK